MTEVAYITSRYPDVSHTFVQREIGAVRAAGIDVRTFSVRAGRALSRDDERELQATRTLLPLRRYDWVRVARAAARHPAEFARLVADAVGRTTDPALAVRRSAYAVEAVLLWDLLRGTGIRHVHAHFANVGADVARLVARWGNAVGQGWTWSFTMHGPTEFADPRWFQLARKAGDADLVACIGDYCRAQLYALTDESRWDRFRIVRCGIDPERFPSIDRTARNGTLSILCVGRLVPEKGQTLLVDAVADLRERGIGCHLVLVGDGPSRAGLEQHARARGIDATFTGAVSQDEILRHYNEADVFCLASAAEGIPVVLMEAMATGLPVVTTAIAGIPELVTDGESGFVVPPGRADRVADAIARLAADPDLRARMGAAGRATVLDRYEAGANGRIMAAELTRVAAAGPRPAP